MLLGNAFSDARDWAQFHSPRSLALAMVGEVGEVCELLQWRRWDGETAGLPQWTDEELRDELVVDRIEVRRRDREARAVGRVDPKLRRAVG